jgi:hypothetical protein
LCSFSSSTSLLLSPGSIYSRLKAIHQQLRAKDPQVSHPYKSILPLVFQRRNCFLLC